jgi:hypothetical protein
MENSRINHWKLAVAKFLTCIWEVPSSNTGQDIDSSDVTRGFSKFLQDITIHEPMNISFHIFPI